MQQYTLIRGVQRERWYFNIKPLATIAFHLVTPAHHPRRRVKSRTTADRTVGPRSPPEKVVAPAGAVVGERLAIEIRGDGRGMRSLS